ncbi:MAG: hypothetical protein EXS08_13945 [Planctomycetes bacterium]|nr:hypothetical protein [Planctomycetota bacterium]
MNQGTNEFERRSVLQLAAGLAAASTVGLGRIRADAIPSKPTGKPGDFDFLSGDWKIQNRWLSNGKWDEFESEATVFGLLDGLASVEELRNPARKFSGMGLRLLDLEKKLWADYWVPGASGVLTPPPSWGSFVDGVGLWDSDDMDGETAIIVRGAWDQITPKSCRWYQAASRDDGQTWEESWIMHWTRG